MNEAIWNEGTYWFYIAIIVLCYISSYLLSKIRFCQKAGAKGVKLEVCIPFLLLLFVKGSSICGTDVKYGYKVNFATATSLSHFRDKSTEFGFRVVNVIIRNITEEYSWFIFAFALITLVPVVMIIRKYRDYINVPLVVLGYVAIFFFQGLSLLRLFAAASFCVLSFGALFEKKYIVSLIWVGVAALFHVTSLIMIIPWIIMVFRINKKLVITGIIGSVLFLFWDYEQLQGFLTGRYSIYKFSDDIHIGTEFIWFYGIIVILYVYLWKFRKKKNIEKSVTTNIMDLSFLWVLIGIFISLSQYVLPILGRMYVYTIPMLFCIGAMMRFVKQYLVNMYIPLYIMWIFYFLMRFNIYIVGYHASDGIVPYINCFGWII